MNCCGEKKNNIWRLDLNLQFISKQVERVLIVDNGSKNINDITALKKYDNLKIICNKENKGIAAALNQIGDVALSNGDEFFVTFDQDSIADSNLVQELLSAFESDRTGMTCPYIDRKHDFVADNRKKKVKTAITSGSMVKTSVWKEIGGFWEYLFIDEVDHEFCYQIYKKGYTIVQTNSVSIDHIIGQPFSKTILGHHFTPTNHSAFRRYYIARNDLIIQHLYPNEKEPFEHRYIMLFRTGVSIIFCEKQKTKKILAMINGIKDAIIWNCKNKEIDERRSVSDRS